MNVSHGSTLPRPVGKRKGGVEGAQPGTGKETGKDATGAGNTGESAGALRTPPAYCWV